MKRNEVLNIAVLACLVIIVVLIVCASGNSPSGGSYEPLDRSGVDFGNLPMKRPDVFPKESEDYQNEDLLPFLGEGFPFELLPLNPEPQPEMLLEPLVDDSMVFGEISDGILAGDWYYEYDKLFFNKFTWTSMLILDSVTLYVKADFDDLQIWELENTLAFRIFSDEDSLHWLYIVSDGSFEPDINYFKESDVATSYPGGYDALERDISDLGVDWALLYTKLRAEFLGYYSKLDPDKRWPPKLNDPYFFTHEGHA